MTEPASPAEPAPLDPLPAAPAATTPSLQPPVLWPVLREMFSLLRRHGLRSFLLAALMNLLMIPGAGLVAVPIYLRDRFEVLDVAWHWVLVVLLPYILIAPALPIESGNSYAVYRLLLGEKVGAGSLFAGFRRLRLYLNLMTVGLVVMLSRLALGWAWDELPWNFCWDYYENLVTPGSPLDELIWSIPGIRWFIGDFHAGALELILLPIQWAALVVFVGGKPWYRALADSATLVLRHWRHALMFIAVVMVLYFRFWPKMLLPYGGWLSLAGCALIQWAALTVQTTALVVIYREMLKRDAAAPPEIA
ncbi:MAG: hypothetical protein NTY65_12235 [Planctomycetota bacterium]|nr:hypothetical protein [Planctomycetota bacterium]